MQKGHVCFRPSEPRESRQLRFRGNAIRGAAAMKVPPHARFAPLFFVAFSLALVLGFAGAGTARAMHAAGPVKPRPPAAPGNAAPSAGASAATSAADSGAILSGFDAVNYGG